MPLPDYCKQCKAALEDPRIFDSVAAIYEKEGADAWYVRPAPELLPPDVKPCAKCGGAEIQERQDHRLRVVEWRDEGDQLEGARWQHVLEPDEGSRAGQESRI